MRLRHAAGIAVLAALAGCTTPDEPPAPDSAAATPKPPVVRTPGPDNLFLWLDEFGLPPTRDLLPGRFVTKWSREPGFRLPDQDGEPRLLTLSLQVRAVRGGAGFDPAPFAVLADEMLSEFEGDETREQKWQREMRFSAELSIAGRFTVLAWLASRRGLDGLVPPLLAKADEYRDAKSPFPPEKPATLAAVVREHLESAFFAAAYGDSWDAEPPSWEERRARLSEHLARFPQGAHAERAREGVAMLTRLIDERPLLVSDERIATLTGDALVDALVLRLRLVRSAGWGGDGGPGSALGTPWRQPATDADRLVALGRSAVPRLLTHLDDPAWTDMRYVGRAGNEPYVHTVGGVVREVLTAITGQWFATRAQGEAWLADVEKRGEPAILADAIRTHDYDVRTETKRLLELDPALALSALLDRLAASKGRNLDRETLRLIGDIDAPRAEAALRRAMAGDDLLLGLVATRALRRTAAAAANAWLIARWRGMRTMPSITYPAASADADAAYAVAEAVEGIARDLGEHAGADGLAALREELASRPALVGVWAVAQIVARTPDLLAPRAPGTGLTPAEKVVETALEDTTPAPTGIDAAERPMLRICDRAAVGLAARFPQRFVFVAEAAQAERDARIVRMRNAFRALSGEPPMPEPPLPERPVVSREMAVVLVDEFANAVGHAGVTAATSRAIEAEGLCMVEWLRSAASSKSIGALQKRALERLEHRLACTVREVLVAGGIADEAVAPMRVFVGRPLDPSSLANAVAKLVDGVGGNGVEVRIHRAGDDTGVVIDVRAGPAGLGRSVSFDGLAHGGFDVDLARGLATWRDDVAEFLDRPSNAPLVSRAFFRR